MIQTIICKCGKTFDACKEPECYITKEWLEQLTEYVIKGCTVKMIEIGKGLLKFEKCECNELDLFTIKN